MTPVLTDSFCWHCGDGIQPVMPRCERCPEECDVEGCNAFGCRPVATESEAKRGTLYATRDIQELDRNGGHFTRHMLAMTAEGLRDKSAIAAELAWRDALIAELQPRGASLVKTRADGAIVIEITPDVVIRNLHWLHAGDDFEPSFTVLSKDGFMRDFLCELEAETESGMTIVHRMFDTAISRAVENGSVHLEHRNA